MLIEAEDLKLTLGQCTILDGVNLHLNGGEIFGLLGPGEAGKSATIRVRLGQYPRNGGRLSVLGVDPGNAPAEIHRRIGVMSGDAGFYYWMTARDYLRWYAGFYGHKSNPAGIEDLLKQVGLAEVEDRIVGRFSHGMRQRLELARALVGEPGLLILHEPTIGLDSRGRREIHDLLLGLARNRGVGILICTRLLDDVDRLCKRIGIIHEGATVVEGSPVELLTRQGRGRNFRLRIENLPEHPTLPAGVSLHR